MSEQEQLKRKKDQRRRSTPPPPHPCHRHRHRIVRHRRVVLPTHIANESGRRRVSLPAHDPTVLVSHVVLPSATLASAPPTEGTLLTAFLAKVGPIAHLRFLLPSTPSRRSSSLATASLPVPRVTHLAVSLRSIDLSGNHPTPCPSPPRWQSWEPRH